MLTSRPLFGRERERLLSHQLGWRGSCVCMPHMRAILLPMAHALSLLLQIRVTHATTQHTCIPASLSPYVQMARVRATRRGAPLFPIVTLQKKFGDAISWFV